jgi:hypothetical protein
VRPLALSQSRDGRRRPNFVRLSVSKAATSCDATAPWFTLSLIQQRTSYRPTQPWAGRHHVPRYRLRLLAGPFPSSPNRPHPGGGIRIRRGIEDRRGGIRGSAPGAGQELEQPRCPGGPIDRARIEAGLATRNSYHLGRRLAISPRCRCNDGDHIVPGRSRRWGRAAQGHRLHLRGRIDLLYTQQALGQSQHLPNPNLIRVTNTVAVHGKDRAPGRQTVGAGDLRQGITPLHGIGRRSGYGPGSLSKSASREEKQRGNKEHDEQDC